jgi:hypothetical protein
MCIWREYIAQVYMKSLKKIHRTCYMKSLKFIWTCPMYSPQTLQINMSYVFSSNSSYKHVLCILLKFFIYVWREYTGHVYMKSLKRVHRTCLYEGFEENTYALQTPHINMSYVFSSNSSYKHVLCILFKLFIIWRVWGECIGHVYMKSLKRIHRTCLYEEFEKNA